MLFNTFCIYFFVFFCVFLCFLVYSAVPHSPIGASGFSSSGSAEKRLPSTALIVRISPDFGLIGAFGVVGGFEPLLVFGVFGSVSVGNSDLSEVSGAGCLSSGIAGRGVSSETESSLFHLWY